MTNAKRDDNFIPVMMGVSSVDGVTPVPVTLDPTTLRLRVVVISNLKNDATPDRNTSRRDENTKPTLAGENSSTQNIEPISIETVGNGIMMKGT